MTNNLETNNDKDESNKNFSLSELNYQLVEINKKIAELSGQIDEQAHTFSQAQETMQNSFLKLSGGEISGDLDLNRNSISNLTTPAQADPLFAANVGYVLTQVHNVAQQVDDLSTKTTACSADITTMKTTLAQCESQYKELSLQSKNPAADLLDISQDINMHSFAVKGLLTPSNKDLDFAANVAFVKACVDPLSGQMLALSQQVESNTKTLCNIQLNFLPTTGGFVYGSINMQNNKITGLKAPSNPKDAVSLEYLNSVLGQSKVTNSVTPAGQNNLLYSTYPNHHVNTPLPRPLLRAGYNGWTWNLSSSYNEGFYEWTNLSFEQTNPDSKCFEFSLDNPHYLLLKQPGEYTLSFSMVALIPSDIHQNYPSIQLYVEEDFSVWGQKNQRFAPSSSKALTLVNKDCVNIVGILYDIVELSPLSTQTTSRIIVTPKQKSCRISLQNMPFKSNEAASLYIVQNHVNVSWTPF